MRVNANAPFLLWTVAIHRSIHVAPHADDGAVAGVDQQQIIIMADIGLLAGRHGQAIAADIIYLVAWCPIAIGDAVAIGKAMVAERCIKAVVMAAMVGAIIAAVIAP